MKTYDHTIKMLLNEGLRPLEESERNGSYLTAVSNARTSEGGLVQSDKYIRSLSLNEEAQVFAAYKGVYILTKDSLYEYKNSTLTLLLTGFLEGEWWSIADFGDYVLFTNRSVNLIRNPTTGIFAIDNGTVFPLSRCICAHRGRLLLAGIMDYPKAGMHHNWVAWSDINNLAFLDINDRVQAKRNLAGYMPMSWEGDVYRLVPMKDKVIVYGDNGILALALASTEEVASTYGQVDIHETGLIAPAAMTTNGKSEEGSLHYFVNNTGWLCTLDENLKVERLGYKEFLL